MLSKRNFLIATASAAMTFAVAGSAVAGSWQAKYPTLTLGVITSENESDRLQRYKPVRDYLEKKLGVKVKWRSATDYAGIIEGVKAKKIELAYFGPASYSKAWLVTKGQVTPVVGALDKKGNFGYNAVVVVKKDSPFKTIDDLKGKRFGFADPNSTSGHQAPRYFLTEAKYDPDTFFGSTTFSGSHENSIMGLMNGTFDGVATWYRSPERSNMSRMAGKGMIKDDNWRVIWKSPKLPSSPWTVPVWLPEDMKKDLKNALMQMKDESPEAWKGLTDGKSAGYQEVTHKDYEAIVRMIKHNLRNRKSS